MLIQQEDTLHQAELNWFLQTELPDVSDLVLTEVSEAGIGLCTYRDAAQAYTARVYCDGKALYFLPGDGKPSAETP